jgi:hypothetical protein
LYRSDVIPNEEGKQKEKMNNDRNIKKGWEKEIIKERNLK